MSGIPQLMLVILLLISQRTGSPDYESGNSSAGVESYIPHCGQVTDVMIGLQLPHEMVTGFDQKASAQIPSNKYLFTDLTGIQLLRCHHYCTLTVP